MSDRPGIVVERRIHRRTPKSAIAMCGTPATQDQLTDQLEDVTCKACWSVMRSRASS